MVCNGSLEAAVTTRPGPWGPRSRSAAGAGARPAPTTPYPRARAPAGYFSLAPIHRPPTVSHFEYIKMRIDFILHSLSPVGLRSFGPHVLPRFSRPQGELVHGRKLPPTQMRTFESKLPIILIGPKFFAPSPATRLGRPALSERHYAQTCVHEAS